MKAPTDKMVETALRAYQFSSRDQRGAIESALTEALKADPCVPVSELEKLCRYWKAHGVMVKEGGRNMRNVDAMMRGDAYIECSDELRALILIGEQ